MSSTGPTSIAIEPVRPCGRDRAHEAAVMARPRRTRRNTVQRAITGGRWPVVGVLIAVVVLAGPHAFSAGIGMLGSHADQRDSRACRGFGGDGVDVIDDGGAVWLVHTFSHAGAATFSVSSGCALALEIEYLVVGGGGGAGTGGGGAGQFISGSAGVVGTTVVEVGSGGAPSPGSNRGGDNGTPSRLGTVVAAGGGGGGRATTAIDGRLGASGGGAGASQVTVGVGGAASAGHRGGDNFITANAAGGGGGAGGRGADGSAGGGGAGGDGLMSTITGVEVFYAGGGGAMSSSNNGPAGRGGGGGSAGGGGSVFFDGSVNAEAGGSGLVVVRYRLEHP